MMDEARLDHRPRQRVPRNRPASWTRARWRCARGGNPQEQRQRTVVVRQPTGSQPADDHHPAGESTQVVSISGHHGPGSARVPFRTRTPPPSFVFGASLISFRRRHWRSARRFRGAAAAGRQLEPTSTSTSTTATSNHRHQSSSWNPQRRSPARCGLQQPGVANKFTGAAAKNVQSRTSSSTTAPEGTPSSRSRAGDNQFKGQQAAARRR